WELSVPGFEGWYLGETGGWWEDSDSENREERVFASKPDTLDPRGAGSFTVTVPETQKGRPARVTIEATVTDVNRQAVGASTSAVVYPGEFYIAAKPLGRNYFWRTGTPQSIGVVAVRPDGHLVPGVRIQGSVVRREWHRVRRERDGVSELVGEWVSDTVSQCTVTTTADTTTSCAITPNDGGIYVVSFSATDRAGHPAATSFERWVVGPGWVPWSDETQFKMDVIPDRARYAVGDTATILFASPFTNTDAWVVVEREGVIEQRRLHITAGSTTLKLPITEAYAPNVYVSILVARGRVAPPKTMEDGGRPTIRVGYAELRVTPEVKRLTVAIEPEKAEYRPADTARVRVRVRDALAHGSKSEVTLWAVDEGVLALTGYKTPDPIDLIYRERGLGMHLASNMTAVAPQIPEGEKGRREAGGGGGATGADILRSRFKTTAFFLGSVVTDADGNAVATAKLPDNLTTFRIMAVAVTANDRYGKGESSLLVTRPLLARQALPRFVREGDTFTAGAVINRRDGAAVPVTVKATATGVTLRGAAERTATLAALRGVEVRFPFEASRDDSATFRFDVTDNQNADAVRVTIPIRPDHHPVTHTIAGVLYDSGSAVFTLPSGTDPVRSQLSLSVGVSPLTAIRGMYRDLRVYPYDCSEQVSSEAMTVIALYRYQPQAFQKMYGVDPKVEIARAVAVLTSRQRSDGAIGYWGSNDWTTPWLSAYAGTILLDARAAGVKVDTLVISRLADYLGQSLHATVAARFTPVASWYTTRAAELSDRVAAVDFLSRANRADVAAENELLRTAAELSIEDRARLAEVLARRGQMAPARTLMEATWPLVRVEGRRAVIPDSLVPYFYFASYARPYARILTATLAVDRNNRLVGPLAEALVDAGRVAARSYWTTQDYGTAAGALAALGAGRSASGDRAVRVTAGNRVLLESGAARDSTINLQGLLTHEQGQDALRLAMQAGAGDGPVYYYLNVTEIPSKQPVTPEEHGLRVERWYERYDTGTPITSAAEGDLVRVRLRLTVPASRTFVVLDDALPAGLEAVDLSLRTAANLPGPGLKDPNDQQQEEADHEDGPEWYGFWEAGWWSPFDHRELRDDRVVYSATYLWPGTYTATYVARATTAGTFVKVPAHAEEMYNRAVYGRSDGGAFVVTPRAR
ncbi:MAG TPA: alpha-2-macroglobulin family protein, partial [Gemmatimonadaceae bacterium]|nr:alpha-2-macroglobulin family protein [Gemmatimonadaceae bacterium]